MPPTYANICMQYTFYQVKNLTAGKQGGSLDAGQPDPTPIVKRGLSEGSEVSSKEQITVSNNNG